MKDQQFYMPDMSPQERRAALDEYADKVEDGPYVRSLSEDEIYQRRIMVTDLFIKRRAIEEEKKAAIDEYKERLKPITEAMSEAISQIRTGLEERTGKQYLIADHENGDMNIYDEDGQFISRRRLRPDEKQTTIHQLGRTAER